MVQATETRKFLSRPEAAAYVADMGLPCTTGTLAKLASTGGGPAFRKFGRTVRYVLEDLDAWVASRLSAPVRSTSGGAA